MNINDLEDFVQLMIEENPGYKNRILYFNIRQNYSKCDRW